MIVRFRAHYINALTSFAHLALLMFAFHLESRRGWIICLSLIALISFVAWIANFRRSRIIGDTPTSRVASAAQGYVELAGTSQRDPTSMVVSKVMHLPCCWYRYEVHRRTDNNKWEHVESGESDEPFLLADATGKCFVDPEGAEIMTSHKQSTTRDDYRYTEWLLFPDDPLYAIGEFTTIGGAGTELDLAADVKALLEQWKRDHPTLLERFDLNKDKTIDLKEWELARAAAKREIEKRHAEISTAQGVHLLQRPKDGRLYLLSNLNPKKLARKYSLWSGAHLVIFFVAGGTALYFAQPG